MEKQNKNKAKWVWLAVLILFVCVAATTIAFVSRLDGFLLDDAGAISLISGDPSGNSAGGGDNQGSQDAINGDAQDATNGDIQNPTQEQQSSQSTEPSGDPAGTQTGPTSDTATEPSAPPATEPAANPGFEASDDQQVWSTNTQVEIFRVYYENGEQYITVRSDDGDKLIAPGTENSYTFKLKNTGNVPLNYTVQVDAYCIPAEIAIPITGRLSRYDGKWIVGDREVYADVAALDAAEDNAALSAGKYTYYTLDWLWPFESGNDELDTQLGNLATEQDLTFTIVIRTIATATTGPGGGITPPQTGDNTVLALWIALAIASFAILIFLVIFRIREKQQNRAEAKEIEKVFPTKT